MTMRLVDVSHYQGTISLATWRAWRARWGLSAAMVKVSEGMTYTDPTFAANRAAIYAAGLSFGGYHYARPGQSSPEAQAQRFLKLLKPRPGDWWCLDLEKSDGLSQAELNAWAARFGDEMRRLWAGAAVAYLGGYSANGTGRNLCRHFDYWMYPRYRDLNPSTAWPATVSPRLTGNTTGWPRPHIWQWTPALPPGIDASVASITTADLASPSTDTGGDLALSASQFDQLMAAVAAVPHDTWAYRVGEGPQMVQYQEQASNAATQARDRLAPLVGDIAAAVVAALPASAGGAAPTVEQLGDEFEARLRKVLGSLDTASAS